MPELQTRRLRDVLFVYADDDSGCKVMPRSPWPKAESIEDPRTWPRGHHAQAFLSLLIIADMAGHNKEALLNELRLIHEFYEIECNMSWAFGGDPYHELEFPTRVQQVELG